MAWMVALGALFCGAEGIETVYVVPMSHTDIGFTAPPSAVAEGMVGSAEAALAQAKADPDFVWVFESFWQLEQWLKRNPDAGAVVERLKEGRFGLSAAYATPHSSLLSDWALEWNFRLPAQWGRAHGLEMDWAVLDDVPGHPFNLPKAMAASGVRYLAMGANQGFYARLPETISNTPFWWEGPDGSRVLTWISADNYTEGYERYGLPPEFMRGEKSGPDVQEQRIESLRKGLGVMRERYAQAGYPYDAVLALHAFDNWGSRAAGGLPETVRRWNESGGVPRLVLATPKAFFAHIEEKYRAELPVYRGGFGGQWETVRLGTPTAMARARAYEAVLRAEPVPAAESIAKLLTYWEHTFGMGPCWPGHLSREDTIRHNREQYELTAAWPLPDAGEAHGAPVSLPGSGEGPLRSNALYLVVDGKYTELDERQWPEHSVERMPDGTLRLRHAIDRMALPPTARVVWAWRLSAEELGTDVVVKTDSGDVRLPKDNIGGYDPGHWVAWQGFETAGSKYVPHGVFVFRKDAESGVLLGEIVRQSLECVFKGGEKGTLSFAEAYPGEDGVFRFWIDVTRAEPEGPW